MLRAIASSLFLLAGCSLVPGGSVIVGAGDTKTETRQVAAFDRVQLDGGVTFELKVGSTPSVTVTAQENLLPITSTTVADGKLTVNTTQVYTTSVSIKVVIVAQPLKGVSINGGVSGTVEGVAATPFAIDADGGANMTISGAADTLTLKADGGARVDGTNLTAVTATVDLDAGANVTLTVSSSVTGTADAGSLLRLLGNPATVNVATSSGASVQK